MKLFTPPPADDTPATTRIEAFSDGVIAIIVTLMIFEIKIPALPNASNEAVLAALWQLGPKLISFLVSFVTVCIFWVNHHHFMHGVKQADRALLWYNNHLLLWLAVIPFVTEFIGEYPLQPVVVALYGFVLMMGAVAFALMINHVFFKGRLTYGHVPEEIKKQEFRRSLIGIVAYAVSVVTAFFHPYISMTIFFLVPVYYFFPRTVGKNAV